MVEAEWKGKVEWDARYMEMVRILGIRNGEELVIVKCKEGWEVEKVPLSKAQDRRLDYNMGNMIKINLKMKAKK